MESEAVLAILKRCLLEWSLIGSEAIDYEISRIPDIERRCKAERIASILRGGCWMSSKVDVRSINEIRKLGIDALAEALGPVDMARFLQSFDLGSGNYTKERAIWLDQSLGEIVGEIKRKRKE